MSHPVNPLDNIAIHNVLSRYCEALDTKVFDLLDKVFTPDVTASYPFNPELKGLDSIRNAIQDRLGPIKTHHNLTTNSIIFGKNEAIATTHFIGVHFGQGQHEGKALTAYGKYIDELVCLPVEGGDYEGVQGASGRWRIKRRTVSFTARLGDERIMSDFE